MPVRKPAWSLERPLHAGAGWRAMGRAGFVNLASKLQSKRNMALMDFVTLTQETRLLGLDTVLDADILLPGSFTASECVSGLSHARIELLARREFAAAVAGVDLIGTPMCLSVCVDSDYERGARRYFHGIVSQFSETGQNDEFCYYRAELAPWLWLLTLDSQCRIYQDQTNLETVKSVLDEYKKRFPKLVDYEDRTTVKYTKADYCVQYRESSFQFVSRLLEEDGICYFFEHAEDKHTLVLADSPSAFKACAEQPVARVVASSGSGEFTNPILSWQQKRSLIPGKYTLRDFHFQMPSKDLQVQEPTIVANDVAKELEVYDYPGEYASRFTEKERSGEVRDEAQKTVSLRMQELETVAEEISARSLCRAFRPGQKFQLEESSNLGQNFVITSVNHNGRQTPWYEGDDRAESTEEPYRNEFTCITDKVPYRPARKTLKPRVMGPQTAIVVGKRGEEIWTDEFGRVKVQFHWDREGKRDENSSCWIRVSQPWAGGGWGTVSIPRIGQEVIIDFLEGDPDQPIITGRVYNAEQMPPYQLPSGGVVSGIKSRSTKGGGGYNELSMDDTKGKEKVTIHAQYDMGTTVEHNDTQTVVHGDRTIAVQTGKHTETIKGDTTITIQSGAYVLNVQNNTHTHRVKGDVVELYSSTQKTQVADDILIQSTGATITIDAKTEIFLHCGASSLSLKQDGTIILSGKNVQVTGSDQAQLGVGNQQVTCNVQKVNVSGAAITSSAVGMHEITGALVKLN